MLIQSRLRRIQPLLTPVIALIFAHCFLAIEIRVCNAAEVSTVYSFTSRYGDIFNSLFDDQHGTFYLTSASGGHANHGTVLRLHRSGRLRLLYSFDGIHGSAPVGLSLGHDGQLYGVTRDGGEFGYGIAFRLSLTGTLTTLHAFTAEEGGAPGAAMILASDGNFYGTTQGIYRYLDSSPGYYPPMQIVSRGGIFRMTPDGVVSMLHTFTENEGANTQAALLQASDGQLYGTTAQLLDRTGAHSPISVSWGTVFKIKLDGSFTLLHSFIGYDGGNPTTPLIQTADGVIYGATGQATAWGFRGAYGSIFSISPNGLFKFEVPENFGAPDEERTFLYAGLTLGCEGAIYSASPEALIRYTPSSGKTVIPVSVSELVPSDPSAGQTDCSFYGFEPNRVFRLTAEGKLSYLNTQAKANSSSAYPRNGVVVDRDTFYGTTSAWASGEASIFRLNPAGLMRNLYTFPPNVEPSELVRGTDGAFYGVTRGGDSNQAGSIFRVSQQGSVRTLYQFMNTGAPIGPLTFGHDGKIYGVTAFGGPNNQAEFYQFDTDGHFVTLHRFVNNADSPGEPRAGLTLGDDGDLYGVMYNPWTFQSRIYRLNTSGDYISMHEFDGGTDGSLPSTALAVGNDSALYGVTGSGGPREGGTIFRMDLQGVFTTLHAFTINDAVDGWGPASTLTFGKDRHWYGATTAGGSNDQGTLFRLTEGGTFSTLYTFPRYTAGSLGVSRLALTTDGTLYGTTSFGGSADHGSIFSLAPR